MPLFSRKSKSQTKAAKPAVSTEPAPDRLPPKQPSFNDLEAEFIGTYHAGKALRMAYHRELILGAFAVLFAVLYFAFPRTEIINHYFATEPNGGLMPMVAYNKPFDTESAVISWTEQAVTGIFSFDALNYRRRMVSAQKDFTSAGFSTFLAQFRKNGLYADMMTRKLMISAVQSGTAVIRLKGLNPQGIYAWQVQIPIHFRLESSNGLSDKKYLATVIVQRVANWKNPRATAISSIALIKE